MNYLKRAVLLMVLAISLLFSSAPTWAQGNEPVHVYLLLDGMPLCRGDVEFAGVITDFTERIKKQNPKNRVSVVVKNEVISDDTYGYFFGNYGGFTHRYNIPYGETVNTLKDSIAKTKEFQRRDDPSYRKVLLIIDQGKDVAYTVDHTYDPFPSYSQYESMVSKDYMGTMKIAEPFCKNQEVYAVRFPIMLDDYLVAETPPYIERAVDLQNRTATLMLHRLQNQGYYEMKAADPNELDRILRRYEKKILEGSKKRVPAPYTITERIIGGDNDRTYDVSVTVEKKPEARNVRNLRFKLSLPAGYEIVKDNIEAGYSTTSEVKVDNISGKYADIQWKIRFRGRTPKAGDKITLTYTNDHYLPERSVKQLDIRPMVLRENYWSFPNYDDLENHRFSGAYIQFLYDSLLPKDRKLIEKGMREDLGGSCYGMAFTSILANENKLDKVKFELRDMDNRPVKNSDVLAKVNKESAKDIIHFYQSSQEWTASRDKAFRIRKNKTGIQKLVQYMHDVEKNGAPPVHFSYAFKGTDGKYSGHSLVMYHMAPSDKAGYDYVIDYYDPNVPGALGNTKLYVNSNTGSFTSSQPSLNGGRITAITPRIDSLDPFQLKEVADEDSELFIKPGKIFQLESFESKRRWTIDTRNMDRTNLPWRVLAGGKGESYYVIDLPEKNAGYALLSEEGTVPVDAMVSYKDQLLVAKAEGTKGLGFHPGGSVVLDGAKGSVEVELVRNKKKGSEENFYAVKGKAKGTVAFYQTEGGLRGEGSLENVQLRYGDGKDNESTKHMDRFDRGYLDGKTATGLPFKDVAQTSWYYPAVRYVYEKKLMTGLSADTFSPETSITRAQMAQIIYNMEGKKPAKSPASFKDVPPSHWSYEAVRWAKENKIVAGYGDGSFKPNDPITRQDAVAIMYRYKVKTTADASSEKFRGFTDRDNVADYARKPMIWAVDRNIINGDNHKRLNPTKPMRRAEMAQILKSGETIFR